MTESFRFRTRSGREILLVPAHAVRPVGEGPHAWRERALREEPRGRAAMTLARDDTWSSSRDTVMVDLGVQASPGRALWGTGAALVNWDDLPSLNDLRPIGGTSVEPSGPSVLEPRTPGAIDPAHPDTWTSFVAFTVVDQHHNALMGRARCRVDATAHDTTLEGDVVEHRPIPALAHIELELSGLSLPVPKTPA